MVEKLGAYCNNLSAGLMTYLCTRVTAAELPGKLHSRISRRLIRDASDHWLLSTIRSADEVSS